MNQCLTMNQYLNDPLPLIHDTTPSLAVTLSEKAVLIAATVLSAERIALLGDDVEIEVDLHVSDLLIAAGVR